MKESDLRPSGVFSGEPDLENSTQTHDLGTPSGPRTRSGSYYSVDATPLDRVDYYDWDWAQKQRAHLLAEGALEAADIARTTGAQLRTWDRGQRIGKATLYATQRSTHPGSHFDLSAD